MNIVISFMISDIWAHTHKIMFGVPCHKLLMMIFSNLIIFVNICEYILYTCEYNWLPTEKNSKLSEPLALLRAFAIAIKSISTVIRVYPTLYYVSNCTKTYLLTYLCFVQYICSMVKLWNFLPSLQVLFGKCTNLITQTRISKHTWVVRWLK